jgi:hypothetical protein
LFSGLAKPEKGEEVMHTRMVILRKTKPKSFRFLLFIFIISSVKVCLLYKDAEIQFLPVICRIRI